MKLHLLLSAGKPILPTTPLLDEQFKIRLQILLSSGISPRLLRLRLHLYIPQRHHQLPWSHQELPPTWRRSRLCSSVRDVSRSRSDSRCSPSFPPYRSSGGRDGCLHLTCAEESVAPAQLRQTLADIDPEAEARLRRKLDLRILPAVSFLYLFCFIASLRFILNRDEIEPGTDALRDDRTCVSP